MTGGIGKVLRGLRTSRQMSLGGLAERAGLSKRTLAYWESGAYQPRLPELEAVLEALSASEAQRAQAFALVNAPRAMRRLRGEPTILRLEEEIGPMPSGGDLLRAMRHRRRLNLEQAAEALRVSPGTLSRWEQGKVIPSAENLDRLLTLLQAHPQERAALTDGCLFLAPPLQEIAISLEELRSSFHAFKPQIYSSSGSFALPTQITTYRVH